MLLAELLHMGVDFNIKDGKLYGSYGLTAWLFTHAGVHRGLYGDQDTGPSLHEMFLSNSLLGTLLGYEIGFEDEAVEDSLFVWEDIFEVALETFERSRFGSARQSLHGMIQCGSRRLERSSYAQQRTVAEGVQRHYPQAWYEECFSIRHNGQDKFRYKPTAYFKQLDEFDCKTETVMQYIKGLEDTEVRLLDNWVGELLDRLQKQKSELRIISQSLANEADLRDPTESPEPPSGPSFLRLSAALIMQKAISLQREHELKCKINDEICQTKVDLAKYDEWKSVTVHFSLSTAGWQHVMPEVGKTLRLVLQTGEKTSEAWTFDVIPPHTEHHITARIYVPIDEDTFDFLWAIEGNQGEVELSIRLPLGVESGAITQLEHLHELLMTRKETPVFDLARSLRGEAEPKFSVRGIPFDSDRRLTTDVAQCLGKGLTARQKEAFDTSLARVPYGCLNITGLTGTGKSTLAAHMALALACTQPVLVVAQSSLEAQNLESLLLKRHRQLCRDIEGFAGKLAMCRLRAPHEVRTAMTNALFQGVLSDQYLDHRQLNKALLGEQGTDDIALHRLVKRFAKHINAHPRQYDERQRDFAKLYLEAFKECEDAGRGAVERPHYFRLFDHCTEVLSEYLLPGMNVVVTTVECAINDLPELYRPRCMILAEAGMMSVATGIPLIEILQPELVITLTDPVHTHHAGPSNGTEYDMEGVLRRRLLDSLYPLSTVMLDKNKRCPPSCWEFARQTLNEAGISGAHAVSDVSIVTRPKFRPIELAASQGILFNGSLANFDLCKSQQVLMNVNNVIDDRGQETTGDATLQAVTEAIKDLLNVPEVFNQDILVQCMSRTHGQRLQDILRREAVMIRVTAPPVPGSQAPIVLTVIAECRCSLSPQQELSSDEELMLALTRAQTFHFMFGCASCLSKIRARDEGPRLMQKFLEHVYGNKQVVEYRAKH